MKFEIRKITKQMALGEYDPAYQIEDAPKIDVWVNPPGQMMVLFQDIRERLVTGVEVMTSSPTPSVEIAERVLAAQQEYYQWWAEILGWTAEEVQTLATYCMEADPALWRWLQTRGYEMILEHRNGRKNA